MAKAKKTSDKENDKARIWWVNHGRTFSKAREGGYLWAPMPVKGGNTFAHWESMTFVKPGDLIFNYAGSSIAAFGIAKTTASKYTEESSNKNMPGKDGWRVDIDFIDLKEIISLEEIKPFIEEINNSISENHPFNAFNGVNNGYLFNFSMSGLNLIIENFHDKIPDSILNHLDNFQETTFASYLKKEGFYYNQDQIVKYITSLHTRPFVLLSGTSGSGKTTLPLKYAQYLDEKNQQETEDAKDTTLLKRRWFKLSYNDKDVINAFQGYEKKTDQVRNTMLSDGLVPLGWDNRDLNQKKIIKELAAGDVIVAYQGAYIVGGIGLVTQTHFFDETGDAYDTFCESSKNFIRVEWIFEGPVKIKDFCFEEYDVPGFGVWVDAIHAMNKNQAVQFSEYLGTKQIFLSTKKEINFPKSYEIIPVGHNWESKTDLLGKVNSRTLEYNTTKSLELILNAKKSFDNGNEKPFFLILDEINLSQIDYFFSDFLSAMESSEKINIHNSDDIEQNSGIPKDLTIPPNLFIVGTINYDESTSRLTSKVLDRVNLIELDPASVNSYIQYNKTRLTNKELPLPSVSKISDMTFFEIIEKMSKIKINGKKNKLFTEVIIAELELFQLFMEKGNAHISYRVINEIMRYLYISWIFSSKPECWENWETALDAQILQRILPKTYDNAALIIYELKCLYCCCFKNRTNKQLRKLQEGKVVDELVKLNWEKARYKNTAKKIASLIKMEEV